MAKPIALPIWDTNDTNTTEPPASRKADGWLVPGGVPEKPPVENFNWWQKNVYEWLKELNDYGMLGWDAVTQYEIGSLAVGSDFVIYRSLTAANINNDPVGDIVNWVDYREFNRQSIVQQVSVEDGEVATGTALIPRDDTIPQNTEGDEYLSLAITPKNALNILKIEVTIFLSHGADAYLAAALFQDAIANALAVGAGGGIGTVTVRPNGITFTHFMVAGTIALTTFKVRAGAASAGTTTFNGASGGRLYGGVFASSMTITETTP